MTRLASGLALAAAALAAIIFLPSSFLVAVACVVTALAAHELTGITGPRDGASQWLVVVFAIVTCVLIAMAPLNAVIVVLIGLALIAGEVLFRNRTIQEAATELVPPLYVGLPLGLLVTLHALLGWRGAVLLIGTVAISDSAQYYSGRAFGRRPLAPAISPKKTVEGAVGGVVVGTAFMAIAGRWLLPIVPALALALAGVIVVVFGIAGDLFESRLKRVAGLKDSSALIPGHGGVLDRIDALLFATPAFYVLPSRCRAIAPRWWRWRRRPGSIACAPPADRDVRRRSPPAPKG
jgi:phosphatidate cytidylyltransferase